MRPHHRSDPQPLDPQPLDSLPLDPQQADPQHSGPIEQELAALDSTWDPWEEHLPARLKPWRLWRGLWKGRAACGGNALRWWTFSVLGILCSAGYWLIGSFNNWRGLTVWDPGTSLDDAIPAIGWTILPYSFYYIFFPLGFLFTPRGPRGAHALLCFTQALLWVGAIAGAFFLALPCRVDLRDALPGALLQGEGLIGRMFTALHGLDDPYNAWPSLHVAFSLCILIYLMDLWRDKAMTVWSVPLWSLWSAMVLSILTTKQHFLFDLITGVLLGAGIGYGYLRPRVRSLLTPSG